MCKITQKEYFYLYDSKKNGAREYEDGLFWLEEAGLFSSSAGGMVNG